MLLLNLLALCFRKGGFQPEQEVYKGSAPSPSGGHVYGIKFHRSLSAHSICSKISNMVGVKLLLFAALATTLARAANLENCGEARYNPAQVRCTKPQKSYTNC